MAHLLSVSIVDHYMLFKKKEGMYWESEYIMAVKHIFSLLNVDIELYINSLH